MKRIAILLLCVAATVSVSAQRLKTVKARGPVGTEERSVKKFTGIKVSAGIDVYLTQGSNMSLSVETEENLHEYIKTEVKNGVLHVFKKVRFVDSKVHKAYVTMNQIKLLKASSSGDIIVSVTDALYARASSSGDIRYYGNPKVEKKTSSSGSIRKK